MRINQFDDLNFAYLLLEVAYRKTMSGKETSEDADTDYLFPYNWGTLGDKTKIEILNEALINQIKIDETTSYLKIFDGIVTKKE